VKSTRLMIVLCACLAAGALWPADTAAQRRGGYRPPVRVVVSAGFYRPLLLPAVLRPVLLRGVLQPVLHGLDALSAQYPYPYGYGYPRRYYSSSWASARLEVKPREAQVYLDGYLVGMVDQFDGVFSGWICRPANTRSRCICEAIVRTGSAPCSVRVRAITSRRCSSRSPRARPTSRRRSRRRNRPDPYNPYNNPNEPRDPRDPYVRQPPPPREPPPPSDRGGERGRTMPVPERPGDRRAPDSNSFGTLNVRVQPGDAVVVIDGEKWDSPEGGMPSERPARRGIAPHRSAQGRFQALLIDRPDPPWRDPGAQYQSASGAELTLEVLEVLAGSHGFWGF